MKARALLPAVPLAVSVVTLASRQALPPTLDRRATSSEMCPVTDIQRSTPDRRPDTIYSRRLLADISARCSPLWPSYRYATVNAGS